MLDFCPRVLHEPFKLFRLDGDSKVTRADNDHGAAPWFEELRTYATPCHFARLREFFLRARDHLDEEDICASPGQGG